MENIKNYLIAEISKPGVIVPGKFRLSSGAESGYYVNVKRMINEPRVRKHIVEYFRDKLNKDIKSVACCGYGGIAIGTDMSSAYGLNLTMIRKLSKKHGVLGLTEGKVPDKGENYLVVDDAISSGGTIRHVTEVLEGNGASVSEYFVVVDRSKENPHWDRFISELKAPLHSIFTSRDLGLLK